jgi:voltage-gated potassium channel
MASAPNQGLMNGRKRWHGSRLPRPGRLSRRQLTVLLLTPLAIVLAGTLGYYFLEGDYSLFDALYMTVITLSTVGYEEVHRLSTRGRVFTIFLIVGGVATFFYAVTAIIRAVIDGEFRDILGRQRMESSLAQLHGHMVVCGYGRMGRLVCRELASQHVPFVVVDTNAEALAEFTVPGGIPLHGDATSDEVLRHAGIDRARALISVMSSDANNLYTTMSARLLNRDLFIVARVEDIAAEPKLKRAGANRVLSPYQIGGIRLAQAVLRPTVMDFIELATKTEHFELQIEEAQVGPRSKLAGGNLKDSGIRADLGVMIVAVKKASGQMVFNPTPEQRIEAGDILVAIGRREHLDQLEKLAAGPDSADAERT